MSNEIASIVIRKREGGRLREREEEKGTTDLATRTI
jgi:hypothetical protein